jgi:hypothetical protein
VRIETTRGPATAVKVTPPSWDPYHAPGGLAIDSATTTSGNPLTVTFTGGPELGTKPCGTDYSAEAVESAMQSW